MTIDDNEQNEASELKMRKWQTQKSILPQANLRGNKWRLTCSRDRRSTLNLLMKLKFLKMSQTAKSAESPRGINLTLKIWLGDEEEEDFNQLRSDETESEIFEEEKQIITEETPQVQETAGKGDRSRKKTVRFKSAWMPSSLLASWWRILEQLEELL